MRILYLVPFNIDTTREALPGVYNKVMSQSNALKQILDNTELISLKKNNHNNKIFAALSNRWNFILLFISTSKKCKPSDVIYIRNNVDIIIFSILIYMFKSTKIVFEIQSIIRVEIMNKKSSNILFNINKYYSYYSLLLLEKRMLSYSDGIVGVTNEITSYYKNLTNNNIKYLTNGNGIETLKYPIRTLPDYNQVLNVLIVANISYWHGIDRFIQGMYEYSGDKIINLHIVGDGIATLSLKDLVEKLHLSDNVIFHGIKSEIELDEIFNTCHIALDGLAGFRQGMTESSSLKSREYCARGVPFIRTDKDPDIPDDWEYSKIVSADESSIDMETVISFANKVLTDPEHPLKMRKFAEEHLEWIAKMKVLKEFLESL